MDLKAYVEIIDMLATAPDGQLSTHLSDLCMDFVPETVEDAKEFLRNLRDDAVYTGGASGFVMQVFVPFVDEPVETHEERMQRIENRKSDERWVPGLKE